MRLKKTISGLLICCSFILTTIEQSLEAKMAGSVSLDQKRWVAYTSPEGDFAASFPTKTIHMTQQETQIIFSDGKEITYFVFKTPKSAETVDFEEILQKAIDAEPQGELIRKKSAQFQGRDALGFIFKRDPLIVEGLYVESNQVLYQVFAVYNPTPMNQEKFRRFIGSFKLINPE